MTMNRTAIAKQPLRGKSSLKTNALLISVVTVLSLMLLLLRDVDSFTAPTTTTTTRTHSRPKSSVFMSMPIEAWNRFLDEDEIQNGGGSTAVLDPPTAPSEEEVVLPELGPDGVFHIQSEAQYSAFVDEHKDSLIVVRFFAQWCKTCRAMEPKFRSIVRSPKYSNDNTNKPILFADIEVTSANQDYISTLGVENVPTVQLIVPGGLVENFACPPSRVHKLKRKLFLYRGGSPVTSTFKP